MTSVDNDNNDDDDDVCKLIIHTKYSSTLYGTKMPLSVHFYQGNTRNHYAGVTRMKEEKERKENRGEGGG